MEAKYDADVDVLRIRYRQIIRTVLQPYTRITYANINVRNLTAFDPENDQYTILSEGWDGHRHHHCFGLPRTISAPSHRICHCLIDTPPPPSTESARLWHRLSRMVHH